MSAWVPSGTEVDRKPIIRVQQVDALGSVDTNGGPSGEYVAATLSDTVDQIAGRVARGVAFGTAGALSVVDDTGTTRTIPSGVLNAGIIHPIRIRRVRTTGTTATNIWLFF